MPKILIKSTKENSNLLKFIINYMNTEKIEFVIVNNLEEIDKDITNIIYIDDDNKLENLNLQKNIPIILISNEKKILKNNKLTINYIITNLIKDENKYTSAQKEYLLRTGIYNILTQKVNELINNDENYNRIIYDLTEIEHKPENWTFKFESINDTYNWLIRNNKSMNNDLVRKAINFYSNKIYDDSVREINYLTNTLMDIKNNKQIKEIFIHTKEELELRKSNYFFKLLLKNISSNYSMYFIDKEKFMKEEIELYNKLTDGIIIYENSVYRDTYSDELSLGIVDCRKETVQKYNEYFDYILEKYGKRLNSEGDINEF